MNWCKNNINKHHIKFTIIMLTVSQIFPHTTWRISLMCLSYIKWGQVIIDACLFSHTWGIHAFNHATSGSIAPSHCVVSKSSNSSLFNLVRATLTVAPAGVYYRLRLLASTTVRDPSIYKIWLAPRKLGAHIYRL